MRPRTFPHKSDAFVPAPFPFPTQHVASVPPPPAGLHSATEEVLAALNHVSRKITDLARELNCLGYFDDENNNRPRAA